MNLGISKSLDYNIYSNEDRAKFVRNLFTPEVELKAKAHYNEDSTKKELEAAANYILYGKDPANDKNFVQKKEVQIDQKYSSYKKKEMESLEGLLEDPNTKEADFQPVQRNCYKKYKPTIDRDPNGPDAQIPGMRELWEAIDILAARVKELKETKQLGLEFYKKNHLLIQLRKEQFVLKDSQDTAIKGKGFHLSCPPPVNFCSDTGYVYDVEKEYEYCKWRADHYRKDFGEIWYRRQQSRLDNWVKSEDQSLNWYWKEVSENTIDFTNSEHIYQFLELYSTLKQYCDEDLNCDLKFLIWELENYIEAAHLSGARKYILIRKIDRATNEQIRRELQTYYGLCYSDNYISTIYKGMICDRIAKVAQLSLDEWTYRNQPDKFKVCSTCGIRYLRDTRNFIKKQNARDGLSARCKYCDKEIRDRKKEENK